MRIPVLLALIASVLFAGGLQGQAAPPERCAVIPDTVAAPSAQQVRERNELRDRIQAVLRAHGQSIAGLLMVDVDSTRRGKVLFIETQVPDSTRAAAIALVADYLTTLRVGRAYQALIRIDGEYPAMTPGRRHCRPELANPDSMSSMMHAVLERHPETGRHEQQPLVKRVTVRMVVTREGRVAFAELERPAGDPLIDANAEAIALRLRFRPATLDGQPFDARFRFNMTFTVR